MVCFVGKFPGCALCLTWLGALILFGFDDFTHVPSILFQGFMQPHLLGGEFTHLEFPRRVQRKEVGKRMLYRDFTMNGW